MFDQPNIIVGLELGTSKICAAVGEVNSENTLNIIGLGQSRSRGVRKGEIVDPVQVEEDIRNAIVEAEEMANVEIRSVFLGVTGNHIRGFNNRGVHPVVSADRLISEDDVQDVIKNAKAINLPAENTVIHTIRQHFHVDGRAGVFNPVGLSGARIEVDVHVIHGVTSRLQTPLAAVRALQLEVEHVAFNGLACGMALLTPEQKEMGSLVIDLGAGVTDFAVCSNGIIQHTGVLAVGGDHVSNDLAIGLKIPLSRAEQLKIEHGSALPNDDIKGRTVEYQGDFGLNKRTLNLQSLQMIMSVRLEELFELIARELDQQGLLDHLRAGVFLCGGGARIPRISELAERVFRLPVSVGKANSINGLRSALDQPEFATAIGLVRYGSTFTQQRKNTNSIADRLRQVTNLFRFRQN
jgi:cell division protein FtsA